MYGFFAKMTPINRHGLLSLALSVFDGPQEKTVEGAWEVYSILLVSKEGCGGAQIAVKAK